MDTAAVGVAQKEDDEERIDEQDIFDGVISFLAAITRRLFSSVLGADNPPFGPVMGKRGEAGIATGAPTLGAVASSNEATPPYCGSPAPAARASHPGFGSLGTPPG